MVFKTLVVTVALAAVGTVAADLAAQGPPAAPAPQTPAPQTPPAGPPGGGRGQGVFPQQQRAPGDPAQIERGKTIFTVTCGACHGVDARGGQLGGPNLLRSQLVLSDLDGERIMPVIQNGRPERGMPPMPVSADDARAVVAFLHSLLAAGGRQGRPPPSEIPTLNVLVGDAAAGQTFFNARCASCHSPTGDLQGIATRLNDARLMQDTWVPGGGGGRGRGRGGNPAARTTAAITTANGERVEGQLIKYDDFIVTVQLADGTSRSFRREDENRPKVEIKDPLQGHKELLMVYKDKDMRDVTAYLMTLK
jgi:cytochrome c oxidase cbb3-type subunit III